LSPQASTSLPWARKPSTYWSGRLLADQVMTLSALLLDAIRRGDADAAAFEAQILAPGDRSHSPAAVSSLVADPAISDTDDRPEAKRSSQPQPAKETAMHTLFDDIASIIVTAAFAFSSAWVLVATVASAV
jgi:hypothetical protein